MAHHDKSACHREPCIEDPRVAAFGNSSHIVPEGEWQKNLLGRG